MGYKFWPVIPHKEDVLEVGTQLKKKMIYLSPDAELDLDEVEEDAAYILGGLIDKTIIKNASVDRARELGI